MDHGGGGVTLADRPGDGMHQMGFAEADTAIEEQRVEWNRLRFGDTARGGIGELVRLAYQEVLEGDAWIERCADIAALFASCGSSGANRAIDDFHRARHRCPAPDRGTARQPGGLGGGEG